LENLFQHKQSKCAGIDIMPLP